MLEIIGPSRDWIIDKVPFGIQDGRPDYQRLFLGRTGCLERPVPQFDGSACGIELTKLKGFAVHCPPIKPKIGAYLPSDDKDLLSSWKMKPEWKAPFIR